MGIHLHQRYVNPTSASISVIFPESARDIHYVVFGSMACNLAMPGLIVNHELKGYTISGSCISANS